MRPIIISMLLLFTLQGFVFSQPDMHEVIFISTNDVHGRIDNFAKMAAYVRTLQKTHKDVFVFNAGDLINGNPVVDEAKEKGYPIFDLMNSVPYTMSCMGNHEFENGEAVLQQRINQSNSVYVCANMQVKDGSPLHALKPFHILRTSDGTSIAVIGLTANSSNPCLVKNVSMESPVKAALRYKGVKDSVNILMALTHIGYKADSILATGMKELDLIIGGHSHTEIPHGIFVNGTLITQAGDKMRYLGKTVLKIRNHVIVSKTFELINIDSLKERDAIVQRKIDAYNSNPFFKKVAGTSRRGFDNKEAIGCLKTDALKDALSLDIAFDHARNISWSHFPKGNITIGDIYEWDSYDYHTFRYELTPAQIRQMITNSFKDAQEPVLFVSGITYSIQKNTGGSVSNIVLKDKSGLLDEHKTYSVGMNSFIACQYMKGITAKEVETSVTAAGALIQYLGKHPQIDYKDTQRVFIQ